MSSYEGRILNVFVTVHLHAFFFCLDNRETVRKMLRELDPEAVEQRRKRRLKRRIYRCQVIVMTSSSIPGINTFTLMHIGSKPSVAYRWI